METFDVDHAETHLSQLVERAAKGEAFVIAKAGKPLVKVVPLEDTPTREPQIFGFMKDSISVPDDFDTMGQEEIEEMSTAPDAFVAGHAPLDLGGEGFTQALGGGACAHACEGE